MTVALLATTEQIKQDSRRVNSVLDQLLAMTSEAADDENFRSQDCHISELLVVFAKLFVDDNVVEYILKHSQVELKLPTIIFFCDLLVRFRDALLSNDPLKQLTCTAAFNIVWSISLHEQYKLKLKEHPKLVQTIKSLGQDENVDSSLVQQYVPKHMSNVKQAADGILCNLGLADKVLLEETLVESNDKPSLMISYSHHNKDFCQKLLKHLSQFDVWIDFNECKAGDLWEKIAIGMRKANVILCLISDKYCESRSCRQEITHAIDHLQKPIVPIYIEHHKAPDWLGK
ncbi:unnamed protein product [Didymodactylos carnosus]|uniref:TIR domain-containing protein n=1 Tax=Didymodactylos carnosus TaxID=1234261 RepID=A0A815HK55_9BILA|nr:unnamed protein product [Didymodactylos carnosus]CAF1353676.1 unnamed protein product [Didymodactylos carnosus]CAF3978285.1 unnamed protein product [Didymodactylos carnosus]CAF4225865.1 unnamed protein product [Didymodactylos carnosus]